MDDPLLTVAEVARRLRVSDKTVRRHIALGNLPAVKPFVGFGSAGWRIRTSHVESLISGQQKNQPAESEDPTG